VVVWGGWLCVGGCGGAGGRVIQRASAAHRHAICPCAWPSFCDRLACRQTDRHEHSAAPQIRGRSRATRVWGLRIPHTHALASRATRQCVHGWYLPDFNLYIRNSLGLCHVTVPLPPRFRQRDALSPRGSCFDHCYRWCCCLSHIIGRCLSGSSLAVAHISVSTEMPGQLKW
jgi:hypothetical protein